MSEKDITIAEQRTLLRKEINKNHVIIKGVEEYYEKIKLVSQT